MGSASVVTVLIVVTVFLLMPMMYVMSILVGTIQQVYYDDHKHHNMVLLCFELERGLDELQAPTGRAHFS